MSTVPLRTIDVYDGPKKEGSYIVLLKSDADKAVFLQHARDNYSDIEVTADWDPNFINGFVGSFYNSGLLTSFDLACSHFWGCGFELPSITCGCAIDRGRRRV